MRLVWIPLALALLVPMVRAAMAQDMGTPDDPMVCGPLEERPRTAREVFCTARMLPSYASRRPRPAPVSDRGTAPSGCAPGLPRSPGGALQRQKSST